MDRHYGMDWLRIAAFGLLILYHIGMFFNPWDWHVKTAQPMDWVAVPMLATNSWRLGLLFAVSGFVSAALFAKSRGVGGFLRNRSARLLIPLLAGIAVFVVPQPWVELTWKHGYAQGFGHFWLHDYFRFGSLEGIVLPTWQHLWFVAYLWLYTAMLGLLLLLPQALRARMGAVGDRVLGGVLVLAVPLALLMARLWIGWPVPDETHDIVGDLYAHTWYFPLFLFGYLLADAPRVWTGVRRWWKLAGVIALAAYAVLAWIEFNWPGDTPAPGAIYPAFWVARSVMGWCAIVALIGIADRFWNRDHPWRQTLTEAVFPFYIIHQTIIVVLGWYLLRFAMPPAGEFALILAATAAGCWAFYAIGRQIAWLRPLIGLRARAS